jgi:hypothetical protein
VPRGTARARTGVGCSHVSTESEVYHEQKSYTGRKFPLLDILFITIYLDVASDLTNAYPGSSRQCELEPLWLAADMAERPQMGRVHIRSYENGLVRDRRLKTLRVGKREFSEMLRGQLFNLYILLRAADRYAYRLWKHCLFCRDCLWREGTSIYSWPLPCFGGDALSRLTGDHPVASLAITLLILSMTPCW